MGKLVMVRNIMLGLFLRDYQQLCNCPGKARGHYMNQCPLTKELRDMTGMRQDICNLRNNSNDPYNNIHKNKDKRLGQLRAKLWQLVFMRDYYQLERCERSLSELEEK